MPLPVPILDDRRFAESLVRKQLGSKPAGKRVLVARLRQRGIDPTPANHAAGQALEGRDGLRDAIDLARRRLGTMKPGLDPQLVQCKVFAYLARRGFEPEVCRSAVEAAAEKIDSPDD